MKYLVRCENPDGGDVFEGRKPPMTWEYDDLPSAIKAMTSWRREGPNGPVRTAELYSAGKRVDALDEIERTGFEPLWYQSSYTGVMRLVSCRPKIETEN